MFSSKRIGPNGSSMGSGGNSIGSKGISSFSRSVSGVDASDCEELWAEDSGLLMVVDGNEL